MVFDIAYAKVEKFILPNSFFFRIVFLNRAHGIIQEDIDYGTVQ